MNLPVSQPASLYKNRLLLKLLIVCVGGMLAAWAIDALGHRADRLRQGEIALARLQQLTYQLNSLEWQAIYTRELTDELAEPLHSVRAETADEIQMLITSGLPVAGLGEVQDAYEEYVRAVDHELALLTHGSVEAAEAWDKSTVDPAFLKLSGLLEHLRRTFNPVVAGLIVNVRTWTFVIVFAALACMGLLFAQCSRSQATHFALVSEQLCEARDHAEAASQTKSRFLASMSHELRTPLNAIIGYSEMLAEDPALQSNAQVCADLSRIRSSGLHLLRLVNDILDLSKIEAGRMEVMPESFDLRTLVSETLDSVRPLAEKNGNHLEHSVSVEYGALSSDLMKVRQVLYNLVSNSCKFTSSGTIHVSARRFRANDVEFVQIAVVDSGSGLSAKQIGKLFNEFSQAEADTARLFGGTGLGLSICRRLCQLLGGDICVASREGVGSVFAFHIPTEYSRKAQPLPASAPEVPAISAPEPIVGVAITSSAPK